MDSDELEYGEEIDYGETFNAEFENGAENENMDIWREIEREDWQGAQDMEIGMDHSKFENRVSWDGNTAATCSNITASSVTVTTHSSITAAVHGSVTAAACGNITAATQGNTAAVHGKTVVLHSSIVTHDYMAVPSNAEPQTATNLGSAV